MMAHRSTVLTALLLLAATSSACAAAPRCSVAPAGAVVRWADVGLDPLARITVVPVIAQSLATLRGQTLEHVSQVTTDNACALFGFR